jgi:hypothetical protein
MCTEIIIRAPDGAMVCRVTGSAEARAYFGASNIVMASGYRSRPDEDECLCPMDIEATAAFTGHAASQRDDGDWDLTQRGCE